jgi:hypothetical protein
MVVVLFVATAANAMQTYFTTKSATDISALAAAKALQDGEDACDIAARTLAKNGALLKECIVRDRGVSVKAKVQGKFLVEAKSTAGETALGCGPE